MFKQTRFGSAPMAIVFALCAPGVGVGQQDSPPVVPRPHVVIILADDIGYGDPQCYNPQSLIPTPYIDRLAREGTRFLDAHSSSAVCTPTRYGLLTGRYCWRTSLHHGIVMPYKPPIVDEPQLTLAEMFQQRGYSTGCIGKWHLGMRYPTKNGAPNGSISGYTELETHIDFSKDLIGGPLDHGFDYFFGSAGCTSSDPPYAFIRNRRTVAIPDKISPERLNVLPGFYPGLMDPDWDITQVDTCLTGEALKFIEQHAQQTSPMFLYFALNTAHVPWEAPGMFKDTSPVGPYGDMVLLADWVVGRVLNALEKQGILHNTLVIFSSDNGPPRHAIGEHACTGPFRGQKNTIWEGGHRVPFVIRWPAKVAQGQQSDQLFCLTDLMASFADLLTFSLPRGAAPDSINVMPALLDHRIRCDRPGMVNDTTRGDMSLRQGHWKFVQLAGDSRREGVRQGLYNLEDDRSEQRNLIEALPEKAMAMGATLNALMSEASSIRGLEKRSAENRETPPRGPLNGSR